MRIILVLVTSFILISCGNHNQANSVKRSDMKNELMAHIRFLASDELRGRKVGEPETKIAARYIAEQFRAAGLQHFNSIPDYLQSTELVIDGKVLFCNNVVGYIESVNQNLKDEYVLLCAHYDHLGVKNDNNSLESDSIFNGARDNAMGTTALIYAAKELTKSAPERSVIFVATTGEEEGMLGSQYFAEHCPVPISNIVFVLNNDGGGFNDTTNIRIGGKNKISFHPDFWNVTKKNGIKCLPYPIELEYLYEKGDNITFANIGIPSIIVSPGFNKIDEEILKYVHKPEDEATDNFDYNYLLKFSQTYSDFALKIANFQTIPFWKRDIKYFLISKTLYNFHKTPKALSIRENAKKNN